jgi:propanol-preferring alcohol dehydrogenase
MNWALYGSVGGGHAAGQASRLDYLCAGRELVPPALRSLERGGTLALAGIHMTPIPSLDYDREVFGERVIRSVTANTKQDGLDLLREAAAIPIKPHTLSFPLADANRALQELKAGRYSGAGVLVLS